MSLWKVLCLCFNRPEKSILELQKYLKISREIFGPCFVNIAIDICANCKNLDVIAMANVLKQGEYIGKSVPFWKVAQKGPLYNDWKEKPTFRIY